ncbi:MAG: hypothetical protein O7G83_01805 [Proteobacteria bacterium]|nr:hypothetical protein [Pseudomonadota bacterium]
MAKLSALVSVVARTLGLPEKTVAIYARHLREARLITTGGRGLGGADMTSPDCTNLLIAVAASNQAKDAAVTIANYGTLPAGRDREPEQWVLEQFRVSALIDLPARHSFGQAIEALITSAQDGSLQDAILAARPQIEGYTIPLYPSIRVQIRGPQAMASVSIWGQDWSEDLTYVTPYPFDMSASDEEIEEWGGEQRRKYGGGDLRQIREFTEKTILVLGELLRN